MKLVTCLCLLLLPASVDAGLFFGTNHKTVIVHQYSAPPASYVVTAPAPAYADEPVVVTSRRVRTKTKTTHEHRHGRHTTTTVQRVR